MQQVFKEPQSTQRQHTWLSSTLLKIWILGEWSGRLIVSMKSLERRPHEWDSHLRLVIKIMMNKNIMSITVYRILCFYIYIYNECRVSFAHIVFQKDATVTQVCIYVVLLNNVIWVCFINFFLLYLNFSCFYCLLNSTFSLVLYHLRGMAQYQGKFWTMALQ